MAGDPMIKFSKLSEIAHMSDEPNAIQRGHGRNDVVCKLNYLSPKTPKSVLADRFYWLLWEAHGTGIDPMLVIRLFDRRISGGPPVEDHEVPSTWRWTTPPPA